MELHANAKLGPAGRSELVRRIEEGDTLRAAAAAPQRGARDRPSLGGGAGKRPLSRSAAAARGVPIARVARARARCALPKSVAN